MRIGQVLEVVVDADTDKADRKLNALGDGAHSGWGSRLALGAGAAFAAVGAAAVGVVGVGVKVAADMENAHVGFETMLGSAEKADAFLGKLKAFAAQTPFEFPDLQTAASRLLAVGVNTDKVIPLMTALGDATSGMGTGTDGINRAVAALQKMQTSGKVTAETMQQLTEAGIPAWDALAAKLGTDVAGAQEKVTAGAVKAGDVMAGIADKAGPGFARLDGMMEKQSQTLGGMFSTLKDTLTMGLADMAAPMVDALKESIGPLTEVLGDAMKEVGPVLGDVVVGLVDVLRELLPAIMPIVKALGSLLGDAFKKLAPYIKDLAPSIALLAEHGLEVLQAFMPLLPVVAQLAVVAAQLLAAIPVPVLEAIVAAFLGFKIIGLISTLFQVLTGTVALFGGALTISLGPILLIVAAVAALAAIAYVVVRNWDTIAAFFVAIWDKVYAVFSAAIGWILDHLGQLARLAMAVMTGGFSELVLFVVRHFDAIKNGVVRVVAGLIGYVAGIPRAILGALGALGSLLFNAGADVVEGLIRGIKSMFGRVVGVIGDLVHKVTGPVGKLLHLGSPSKLFHQYGAWTAEGLANGILSGVRDVEHAAGRLATAAAGADIHTAVASGSATAGANPNAGAAAAARAAAAGGISVVQHVAGSVITERELIAKARDALIRVGEHNAGAALAGLA